MREEIFGPDGALARVLPGWEPRAPQEAMAEGVARALDREEGLVVEAGTGVGKSLAYLLPAALWAVRNARRVIVSTHTRALQEQLVHGDLPVVARVLAELGLPLKYEMLMGADNYLCVQRLARLRAQPALISDEAQETVARLDAWARGAQTGHRAALPVAVPQNLWDRVARDTDVCFGPAGPAWDRCLWRRDRERAEKANIVVVNHALLLSGARLPPYDAIILDEAHNLEGSGGRALRLRGLAGPHRDVVRRDAHDGTVGGRRAFVRRGGRGRGRRRGASERTGARARAEGRRRRDLRPPAGKPARRLRAAGVRRAGRSARRVGRAARGPGVGGGPALASGPLGPARPRPGRDPEARAGDGALGLLAAHRAGTARGAAGRGAAPRRGAFRARRADDPHVGDLGLRRRPQGVQGARRPAGRGGIGLGLAVRLRRAGGAVVRGRRPRSVGRKRARGRRRAALRGHRRARPGGVFLLFSSWKLLKRVHAVLRKKIKGRPVWAQGATGHEALLEQFESAGDAVLLGVDTFWQGVDVPGPALSCVVLTKLPFANVSSPLEEARRRWLEENEGDYFRDWSLPKAVMKFRQGFGRLIRSGTDRGAVVCLDSRLLRKGYGKAFLKALPPCRRLESLDELASFFRPSGGLTPE